MFFKVFIPLLWDSHVHWFSLFCGGCRRRPLWMEYAPAAVAGAWMVPAYRFCRCLLFTYAVQKGRTVGPVTTKRTTDGSSPSQSWGFRKWNRHDAVDKLKVGHYKKWHHFNRNRWRWKFIEVTSRCLQVRKRNVTVKSTSWKYKTSFQALKV